MKLLLALLFIFFSSHLHAQELIFFEDNKPFRFHFDEESFLMISHDCQKECQAYLALRKITKQNIHRNGGANPGAIICVEQLDGKIRTLTDKTGDQNSFCEFEDKSLVGLGSLQRMWQDLGNKRSCIHGQTGSGQTGLGLDS